MSDKFLTPEEAEAIIARAMEHIEKLRLSKVYDGSEIIALIKRCYGQALEEHTAKPGTREFCAPRKPRQCDLFMCNTDAGYTAAACVHPDFDGKHCPFELAEPEFVEDAVNCERCGEPIFAPSPCQECRDREEKG